MASKRGIAVAEAYARLSEADSIRRSGDPDRAAEILDRLIQQHPEYVGALFTLSLIEITRQNYGKALSLLTRAAMLDPHNDAILANLGSVYMLLNAPEMAARTLERAATIGPDNPEIQFALGKVYAEEKRHDRAIGCQQRVLALVPDHAGAAYELGKCYIRVGRFAEAVSPLIQALRSPEFDSYALSSLSQLPPAQVEIDLLHVLEELKARASSGNDDGRAARIQFAAAAVHHGRKAYDKAWQLLVEANAVVVEKMREHYEQKSNEQEFLLSLARGDTAATPASGPWAGPRSIFVLGPSRSGKTSLERLLLSLGSVATGCESGIVDRVARWTCHESSMLPVKKAALLPPRVNDLFCKIYQRSLCEDGIESRFMTNTNPGNIANVGHLYAAIPGARFVFVQRDTMDTGFRIFSNFYKSTSNCYAYDLRWIRDHLTWYREMMGSWQARFPDACMTVSYEALVAEPRQTLSKVAEFCGIPAGNMPAPEVGDDRGCAAPYASRLAQYLTI